MKSEAGIGHALWLRRVCLGLLAMSLTACVPPRLLKYSAFHEREFAPRSKPAELQNRSTAEVLAGGYLLIGYIDLRRNVRTCYDDRTCTNHADRAPADTDLQQEAALKGGDVVTLLEDRSIVERNDKSVCTGFYTTTTMVNGTPVTTTYCSAYRTVPGRLEALISRALVWRHEPTLAAGDANARAIEAAFKALDAAQQADEKPASRTLIASRDLLKDAPPPAAPMPSLPEMDEATLNGRIETAIERNDQPTLRALAKDGRLNVWRDDKGRSALMLALVRRKSDAARTLLPLDRDFMRRDTEGLTALDYAVATSDLAFMKQMVAVGYDLRDHNGYGQSPLFFATLNGHTTEVFEWLLERGLRASETDANDATPLMFAAEIGQLAHVRRILKMAVDIDAQDRDGRTALMVAARGSREDSVRALLAASADARLEDKRRLNALHYAAAAGDMEIVRLLYSAGASPDAIGTDGASPFLMAVLKEKWAVAEFLAEKGASPSTSQFPLADIATTLVAKKQLALLKHCLSEAPDMTASFKGNPEWLVFAAKASSPEIVRFVIATGAPLNRAGRNGITPLMAASQAGNDEVVRLLLELKADARLRDEHKQTALQMATQNGHDKVVALLGRFGVRQ